MDPLTILGIGTVASGATKLLGLPADLWATESEIREKGRLRRDQKEIALKELALKSEEMGFQEKERAFNRLLDLMAGSHKMTEEAASVSRLKALRNA